MNEHDPSIAIDVPEDARNELDTNFTYIFYYDSNKDSWAVCRIPNGTYDEFRPF